MKEPLKDRIDVLFEKAKSGDSKAQLKLAKCFYSGKLVEQSIDQAKYWAFKAILAENKDASIFYKTIISNK